MADGRLQYQDREYDRRQVVGITVVPSYSQPDYALDNALGAKLVDLVSGIGPTAS